MFSILVPSRLLNPWGPLSPYILGNAQSETCIGSTLMVYRALAHLPRTLATHTQTHTPHIHKSCAQLSAHFRTLAWLVCTWFPHIFASASLAWINWNSDPETQKGMGTLNTKRDGYTRLKFWSCGVHSQADRRWPMGHLAHGGGSFQRQC